MHQPQYIVLLIDDEPGQLELTRMGLEEMKGIKVTAVSSAKQALELMSEHHFDAVVSDYQMPAMTGIDLLRTSVTNSEQESPRYRSWNELRQVLSVTSS